MWNFGGKVWFIFAISRAIYTTRSQKTQTDEQEKEGFACSFKIYYQVRVSPSNNKYYLSSKIAKKHAIAMEIQASISLPNFH